MPPPKLVTDDEITSASGLMAQVGEGTVAYYAEATGLGAVPIGTGDSDVFAAATSLAYDRTGSTAEIAISTRAQPPSAD